MGTNLINQIVSKQKEIIQWCFKNNFQNICVILEYSIIEIKVHFFYRNKIFSIIWLHYHDEPFENGVWEILEIGSRKDVLRSNNLDEFLKYIGVKDARNKNKQNN